jgi:HlyD family secretion protein
MAMDKPRDASIKRNKKIRRVLYVVLAVGAIGAVSIMLSRLKPAAQTVERATMIIDTVKQGELVVERRGLGTLVPEEISVVPATTSGRVIKRGLGEWRQAMAAALDRRRSGALKIVFAP